MGSVCCCLRPEDSEDLAYSDESAYDEHGTLPRRIVHRISCMYTSIFQREEIPPANSFTQGTTSSTTYRHLSDSFDNSSFAVYCSPPLPLPFDADTRCSKLLQNDMLSRSKKESICSPDESLPLQKSGSDSGMQIMPEKLNWSEFEVSHSGSPRERLLVNLGGGVSCFFAPVEDECPTCLEEYTLEDPKIMTECAHHFHLACIYEWKERNNSCPVCGKELIFSEYS